MNEKTPKDSHYARLRRQHRDMKRGQQPVQRPAARRQVNAAATPEGVVRLYGLHTISAALANPRRKIHRLLTTRNGLARLDNLDARPDIIPEIVEPRAIEALVGSDAVHQGVMIDAEPLQPRSLAELSQSDLIIVLDQVTDPHNVGAIMRSAVAFNAGALITTTRHSPQESGVLAKAASGALELIDHITVRNLAETLQKLHLSGFQTFGLDSEGPLPLEPTLSGEKIALVLGAEGKGLRQKTRETVTALARLDMPGQIKSLNVSNAAAIALYAARQNLK